jgi:predicted metal-binding membrane protein
MGYVKKQRLEAVLKRDRLIVGGGLAAVVALASAYTIYRAWDMRDTGMDMEMTMPRLESWGAGDFFLTFVMWAVMMVAMMTPSATPMLLTFANINRRRREQQRLFVPTGVFLLGYLVVWAGLAVAATLVQWGLHEAALLSPRVESTSPLLGGVLLLVAGIYQWTPLKRVCLTQCRSPLGFIMSDWREGTRGALGMGLRHGTYCLGCCWVLMGLLFVAGVMNLLWVASIAVFILVEKVAPAGNWVGRATGLLLIGWGALVVTSGLPWGADWVTLA